MGTIHEVAQLAGVSPTTVSIVLNNKSGTSIPETTRQRVAEAAAAVGYRPNPYARALVGAKAPLIKLIYRPHEMYIGNLKGSSLLTALGALDREILTTDIIAEEPPETVTEALLWGAPEAVVFQWVSRADSLAPVCIALHHHGVHCLIADCWELPAPDVPCDALSVDRQAGVALGVEHLLQTGHRHIGLLAVTTQHGRREGYEAALSRHRIAQHYPAEFEVPAPLAGRTRESAVAIGARSAATELLDANPQISALMCGSDMAALGAMRAIASRELKIPDDVALVGFHGEPWTELLPVPLTTVAEPVAELCRLATDCLSARLAGDTQPWHRARIIPDLIVRSSTKEGVPCAEASH